MVAKSIQQTLQNRYKSEFWVTAEMSKLNYYAQSGHCYPILIEKQEGKIVAQLRAIMWNMDFTRVNARFLQLLNEPLKDGIKILFKSRIEYDPIHGLSLHISDIDPSYTLGDLEREKLETIEKLKEEGLFNLNKTLTFPFLPQRIAVISLESSDGYADFVKVLDSNPWKYAFFHHLFPAFLQGEKAIKSITAQLKKIARIKSHFDVVVIVRGGGGDIGLSYFNHYDLAKAIALFPLPVVTGIGHSTNLTVSEMVAYDNTFTPSVLADFFIQKFHNVSVPLMDAEKSIHQNLRKYLEFERSKFQSEIKIFKAASRSMLQTHHKQLNTTSVDFVKLCRYVFRAGRTDLSYLKKELTNLLRLKWRTFSQRLNDVSFILNKHAIVQIAEQRKNLKVYRNNFESTCSSVFQKQASDLAMMEKSLNQLDPVNVLQRGYSITRFNGKAVQSVAHLKKGDVIQTALLQGSIESIIQNIEKD